MALRAEIVDLIRLHLLHDVDQAAGVGEVSVMQNEISVAYMRVFIEMIDPAGVKQRGTALDAVDLIAFPQQKIREISSVLPGDTRDQCCFLYQSCTSHQRYFTTCCTSLEQVQCIGRETPRLAEFILSEVEGLTWGTQIQLTHHRLQRNLPVGQALAENVLNFLAIQA